MRCKKIIRSGETRNISISAFFTRLLLLLASATFSFNALADPQIVSPSAGSTLSGSAPTFTWDFDGTDVERTWLYAGTTPGANDLANSGDLGQSTEYNATGLPVDGSLIHVRFFYFSDSQWSVVDSSYTAAIEDISPPVMLSPTANSKLTGANFNFEWSNNNTPVNYWWLYLGTTQGENDLYDSGADLQTQNSVTVNGLPTDGNAIHARLWFHTAADGWNFADSMFFASDPPTNVDRTANYQITFTGSWSAQTHPTLFPANAHFSGLVGAVHSDQVVFWEPGQIASDGIESMAETGSKSLFLDEINSAIASGHAQSPAIDGAGIELSPGSVSVNVSVSLDNPNVTLATMLAPSPDWFTGFHNVSLLDENGLFVSRLTIDGFVYDSGTDSGLQYTSGNSDTQPRDTIRRLTSESSDSPFVEGLPLAGQFVIQRLEQ